MKIGYLSTIYHTSFILKSGKFPIQSSDEILWKLYSTGPEMIKAFANKDIDLGYIGLPPVMMGIEQGMKIKCVAGDILKEQLWFPMKHIIPIMSLEI